MQILTDWQDKKGDRRFLKLSKEHDVGPSVKHGKPKKQKLEGKGGHGTGPGPGRPKSKNLQPKIPEYEFQDDPIEVPRIPKNDAPNRCGGSWAAPGSSLPSPLGGKKPPGVPAGSLTPRPLHPRRFWASVEPYCADLTNEEVRVLEELLKPPEDEAEHYKVRSSRAPHAPFIPHPLSCPLSSIISLARPRTAPEEPLLILTTRSASGGAVSPVLSVPPACPHRSRPWGSTTRSAGPRRTCWRSRRTEPGLQPLPTRRKASWGRSPSWTPKVPSSPPATRGWGLWGEILGGWHPASAEPELPPPRC